MATVECNQADVGCLKDGPVTFEYLYIPLINHEYYPRCQDDTRYKMIQAYVCPFPSLRVLILKSVDDLSPWPLTFCI